MSDRIKVTVRAGPEQPENRERIVHLLRRMPEIGRRVLREENGRNGRKDFTSTKSADSGGHQPG